MREVLSSILQNAFRIRPEEAKRTGMAFFYLFTAIGAFIIGRTARTVLFLEIPNYREQLPLVYVLIAITVASVMYGYSRIERVLRRDQTNAITLVILILGTLGFRLALNNGDHFIYWAFYIWVELVGAFLIVQFWTLTNEIFNSRQAKRVFAIIGGGGVLANIALGLVISRSVRAMGTENLLYLLCGCLVISLAMVLSLGRNAREELTAAKERAPSPGSTRQQQHKGPQKVLSSRHIQLIALVVVLTYLVSTLVDYQFQVIVGDSIPGKDDRSAFFGSFFAVTGLIGGFVQFFVTARLLERFGVLVALILLPLLMLSGAFSIILVPVALALWAAAYTKGAENVLRYTVNDTTLQLLYLPLPAQTRGRAKAFIDGILRPVSIGTAGILLAVLVGQLEKLLDIPLGFHLSVYQLSWVVAVALLAWLGTLLAIRKQYLKSLVQTLQRRRLNLAEATFSISDQGTIQVIDRALESERVGEVLHALELLPHVSPKLRGSLNDKAAQLLTHEAQEVRVAALDYLGATQINPHADEVRRLLEDPAGEVRASATLALCAIEQVEALDQVCTMLEDPDAKVRACAIVGLIRHGGLDGVLACADLLKQMLSSDSVADRQRAAWILGEVGVQNFYQPLVPLFRDEAETVRLAAVIAAGKLRSPQLVEPLIGQLDHSRTAGAAVASLAAYGPTIRDTIAALLEDKSRPAKVRAQAPRILARLDDKRVVATLGDHLLDDEPSVRGSVISALVLLADRIRARVDTAKVHEAIRMESKIFFDLLAMEEDLRLTQDVELLTDALTHRKEQVRDRVFALLSLLHPQETIELVGQNIQSSQATTRANAIELLDNLLGNEEKPLVLPMVDDAPSNRKLQVIAPTFTIQRRNREQRLKEILQSKDPWLQVCAAIATSTWGLKELEPHIASLAGSDSSVCRETAMVALGKLEKSSHLRPTATKLRDDPVRHVKRYAEQVLALA